MQFLRFGTDAELIRPCVDCGRRTGRFCDGPGVLHDPWTVDTPPCFAAERVPGEEWRPGQRTPLCSECDQLMIACCHYCRGEAWCQPPPHADEAPLPAWLLERGGQSGSGVRDIDATNIVVHPAAKGKPAAKPRRSSKTSGSGTPNPSAPGPSVPARRR